MNEYSVPISAASPEDIERMLHHPPVKPETARTIPIARSLDIIMDRLTDTESVLERILRCISASCPARDPQRPEFHSLQEQTNLIGEKSDRILNMANEIYFELFGEEGVRNG